MHCVKEASSNKAIFTFSAVEISIGNGTVVTANQEAVDNTSF